VSVSVEETTTVLVASGLPMLSFRLELPDAIARAR
jgi:hypothetical protein